MSSSTSPPTGLKPIEIHISDVRTYKQCRRKWNWSSPLGRNLEPAVPYAPFFTGRAVHHVLGHYYETGDLDHEKTLLAWLEGETAAMEEAAGALWPQEQEKIKEQVDLITGIMDHYRVWQKHDEGMNADKNLRFIATEMSFHLPLTLPIEKLRRWYEDHLGRAIEFAGRFDGVVYRESDDTYWLYESKTTRSIKELKRSLANDEQAGLYAWAAQQIIGHPIAGVLYNIMRKKIPAWPRTLQSGMLSQQANIDTTLEVYWEAAKTAHPDMTLDALKGTYGEMLQMLQGKGNTFFERYEVRRTQRELNDLVTYLKWTAAEMLELATVQYPNPSWMNCNFCHFRAPCLVENAGGDTEFVLSQEYVTRKGWQDTEAGDLDLTPPIQNETEGSHEKSRLE